MINAKKLALAVLATAVAFGASAETLREKIEKGRRLIGPSWGGFFSACYAAAQPENVARIYFDAPLMNLDGRGVEFRRVTLSQCR